MYCKNIKKFFKPSLIWHSNYKVWYGEYLLNGMPRAHGVSAARDAATEVIEGKFNKYLIELWKQLHKNSLYVSEA